MTKKEGIFDKIKPEDCVFGDSLGEGKYHPFAQNYRNFFNKLPYPSNLFLSRCFWKRQGGLVEE
jgi:hypothetical protein